MTNRHPWTRRNFLRASMASGVVLASQGSPQVFGKGLEPAMPTGSLEDILSKAPRARYWTSAAAAKTPADCLDCHQTENLPETLTHSHQQRHVGCRLCAHNCLIAAGERGKCRARMNIDGELKSLVYGRPISVHVDPIEKKPFFHFLPGSAAFSLATSGCPLRCKFCQNWEISQARPEDFHPAWVSPRQVVRSAISRKAPVIAFTYNEPSVFVEYLTDIARLGRDQKRRSVLVSCGFMNEAPLQEMCEVLDAIKIDLKGYSEDFYRQVCGAELRPVLRSIKQVAASGTHLELVNLVVPTLNDSATMMAELCRWMMGELGPDIPVHFTRFHPDYKLPHLPPTPLGSLERARDTALRAGLHYPFVGNVPGHPGNHTYCPGCGEVVIRRNGFFVVENKVHEGRCKACSQSIAGVWQ